ncbi:interleukin-20 receptor subunit alpha isoform X2 [Onychomys torridus]|uniref:interleukin-20 receptor subunit alpha isoform X2 n=1 Tax=Onychomys torridus TaxID=38674 RepID=UPI00167F512C|nr:interleukin-20 receptor subunit alpha isoform X2 [Onychomys torridus]
MSCTGIHRRVYVEMKSHTRCSISSQVGPPEVALTSGERSISIALTAPAKWKRNPTDDSVSMQQVYSKLRYNVSVYDTESRRKWSQCITNSTLVLSRLEPSTLYCVHVESFVPGPPRLTQPSQKQCISTLEDQMSALKVKVIFWYVLPTSVIVFLFSVIGYSVYRYIHVGKEKHPSNLILIYGNEIKRVFEPAEAITLNFITLNMLDDSKISQKDMSFLEKSSYGSNLNDPEFRESQEPHLEEAEGQHVGYSSHLMDIVCSAEQSDRNACLARHEWLSSTMPTGEADAEHEYSVPDDFYRHCEDHQLCGQEEASRTGELSEPQAALANLGPPLEDLHHLGQEHLGAEEGPEEEPSTTLVDWDPQTGKLCIPSLPSFGQDLVDYGLYERDRLSEDGFLSRFFENQAEDENENYLIQFMEEWGLHVQMES